MFLSFSKMHGSGNDFMIVDGVSRSVSFQAEHVKRWADRHHGVGFDQLLLIEPSQDAGFDFYYRIFNADGSEVSQCGNGARCAARFIYNKKLSLHSRLKLKTHAGVIETELLGDHDVRVNMGVPKIKPITFPGLDEKKVEFNFVDLGNPHLVLFVEGLKEAPFSLIENLKVFFPEGINIELVQRENSETLKVRVIERGVGETLSCGSGACAAMVSAYSRSYVGEKVAIELPGGTLSVEWKGKHFPVFLTGPVAWVFDGQVIL